MHHDGVVESPFDGAVVAVVVEAVVGAGGGGVSPRCPLRLLSHPHFSMSPRLQFLVSVKTTPAALMACTNATSRDAGG